MLSVEMIGFVYVTLGVIYIIPAILCLFVLSRPPLAQQSSFKMMCFISLMDILNITACCFMAGIYSLTGATHRNTPSMLTVGSITLALWVSYCAINITLALDRLSCFCSEKWNKRLFGGKRSFVWIGLAVLAGAQMMIPFDGEQFYHYDSSIGGWRFELQPRGTKNYRHMLVNVGTFAILVVFYVSIVITVCRSTKEDKLQTQAAFQSAAICGFAMGADIFCIIVQNIDNPSIALCYGANLAWQLAHGGTGYVCLLLNITIRDAAFLHLQKLVQFVGIRKKNVTNVVAMTNSPVFRTSVTSTHF